MSRTSEYGNLINKLAPWVFGGDYGQISNMLNDREMSYEKLQAQEMANDQNEMKLDKERRQRDFEEELKRRDIFGGNDGTPATLRDMYGRVRDVAMEQGNVDYAMRLEEKLQEIQDQQEKEARQKILQGREDERWNWEKERRGRTGEPKKEKTVEMYNPETEDFARVPESQLGTARKLGYVDKEHPLLDEKILEAKDRKEKAKKQESSSGWPWGDSPPMVAPSPTPLARGDRARQMPAPGDEIATITRKRTKAVKGD